MESFPGGASIESSGFFLWEEKGGTPNFLKVPFPHTTRAAGGEVSPVSPFGGQKHKAL